MEVAMPISGTAIDCYEDMFKEITRKLYGEDAGLPELNVGDRLSSNIPERSNQLADYDVDSPLLKTDDHLTAFGLAALMQNGFPSTGILNTTFQQHNNTKVEENWIVSEENLPWTQSKIATYNAAQKTFRCSECDCVGILARIAEHWLGTHSNIRAFRCPQCPYESAWARCVRMHLSRQHSIETDESNETLSKNNPVLHDISKFLQRLKNKIDNSFSKPSTTSTQSHEDFSTTSNVTRTQPELTNPSGKRYSCTFCPYATDRRDLFTRHENIHREEKPFQCYVCQKQFNRADHVKKHFLRMHREHPYDLNRIRRHPPKNASGMSYYQKYNSGSPAMEPIGNSLSIPNGFQGLGRSSNGLASTSNTNRVDPKCTNSKNGLVNKNGAKKKGDKRFTCCYCSWSGVDNWCLKRHMNTHLKPFVCGLCDYKAARSERLATHVLKVHNKRACGKCSFLADEPAQLIAHQQEHHPLDQRNRNNTVLRNTSFNENLATASCSQGGTLTKPSATQTKPWKSNTSKQHGAARLFSYMEASDGSEPESESRTAEDMSRINLSHRIQSDFPEAGDVEPRSEQEEELTEEMELPLFVCQTCGCEFEDDASLDTHQITHRLATSPATKNDTKENLDPSFFRCQLCSTSFVSQFEIIVHMSSHSNLSSFQTSPNKMTGKLRKRKQNQSQRFVIPFWDSGEVEVLRHLNGKLRRWRNGTQTTNVKLTDKYMAQLVTKNGLRCPQCPSTTLSRFHSRSSLAFHKLFRHNTKKFKCEHCDLKFAHRYQVVLHGGRAHVKKPQQWTPPIQQVATTKIESNFLLHQAPDVTKLSELGMAFLDHSFMQTTNSINHLPIIIPTFPPN